jgi:hypothetical protein
MMRKILELPWEQQGWLNEATAWIDAELTKHSRRRTEPVQVLHQRPWSTFIRIPTDQGVVFFKAPAPPLSDFEAPLTEALSRWRPDVTVPVIAVDADRGWFLSEEAGVTLRSAHPGVEQVEHWVKLLPICAEMQIELAARVPELLGFGMPDRRLAKLPQLYAEILDPANENLRVGQEPGLTVDEYDRLKALAPRLRIWSEELAAFGIAETLTHEEVHDANVLVEGERYIFADWSDSSVAHPFFTMVVTIRAAAYRLKLSESGPEMQRLRDAYLEPFERFAVRTQLLDAFSRAYRLGMLNRALSWNNGTGALPLRLKEQDADAVPEWLQDFLKGEIPFVK